MNVAIFCLINKNTFRRSLVLWSNKSYKPVSPTLKSSVAYYLLLIYLFALCKPVMPVVQDIIAHTFFEHQHITSVHKNSGERHLSTEIGKLAKDGSTNEKANSAKGFDTVAMHLACSTSYHILSSQETVVAHSNYYIIRLSAIPLGIQLPPPRA